MLVTSSTQTASQEVPQQKGSLAQIRLTQPGVSGGSSHPPVRDGPTLQSVCAHVPMLAAQARLPQTVRIAFTQWPSQKPEQQNGSVAQTAVTQGSHAAVSGGPTAQGGCAQEWASAHTTPLFCILGPAEAAPAGPSHQAMTGLTRYQKTEPGAGVSVRTGAVEGLAVVVLQHASQLVVRS